MTVELYTVETTDHNGDRNEVARFDMDYQAAKDYAREHRGRVVVYEFEFSDSHVVDDFGTETDTEETAS